MRMEMFVQAIKTLDFGIDRLLHLSLASLQVVADVLVALSVQGPGGQQQRRQNRDGPHSWRNSHGVPFRRRNWLLVTVNAISIVGQDWKNPGFFRKDFFSSCIIEKERCILVCFGRWFVVCPPMPHGMLMLAAS